MIPWSGECFSCRDRNYADEKEPGSFGMYAIALTTATATLYFYYLCESYSKFVNGKNVEMVVLR